MQFADSRACFVFPTAVMLFFFTPHQLPSSDYGSGLCCLIFSISIYCVLGRSLSCFPFIVLFLDTKWSKSLEAFHTIWKHSYSLIWTDFLGQFFENTWSDFERFERIFKELFLQIHKICFSDYSTHYSTNSTYIQILSVEQCGGQTGTSTLGIACICVVTSYL